MNCRLFLFSVFAILSLSSQAQIKSGPMLGYVEMREALIWVQTETPTTVELTYHPIDDESAAVSLWKETKREEANTAHFVLEYLLPGEEYFYYFTIHGEVFSLNSYSFKTQPLWQYRTEPPAFTFATGSCAYINEERFDRSGPGYGGDYRIFETMASLNPDMMLWLGDNIYLRTPDVGSRSGIHHRYTHTRQVPELQKLLVTCPNYAIWDDHDYGPNDADRSFIHKDWTLEAFKLFWGNPSYGIPGQEGITSQFTFGDADFFLMDNRYYRSNYHLSNSEHQIWGEEQVDWLIEALKYSKAPFKFVATGGQFLSDAALYENHAQYETERQEVLSRIAREKIKGVVFLTGDRHHTELSKTTMNGIDLYDLTASPLTSTSYDHSAEPNTLRVEDTIVGERNFCTLTIDGPRKERVLTIRCYDTEGKELWNQIIPQTK